MTPIPLNDLGRRTSPFREQLAAASDAVVRSGYFVLGPAVANFEREFAGYCGVEHCIGVANGTDALEIALKSAGVSPGDRVALCANAAMYGTSAVIASGAIPCYVDIEPGRSTMDPAELERIASGPDSLRAVIVTHLYGQMADMDAVSACAARHGLSVIEDCAQAHGAIDQKGRRAGSIGDAAAFSFYPTKNLGAIGDAGAVVTRSERVANLARQYRQYGWAGKYDNRLPGGRNSRLDEIQASFLSIMLPSLDAWNQRRRHIAMRYSREILNSRIDIHPCEGSDYVAHLYVVRSRHRDALKAHLASHGIASDIHYPIPDHRQACHAGRFDDVILHVTDRDSETVLTLPCFPELTDDEVSHVIDACNLF
ncbi:DegT/DnrJ/EryC1/StrS family aminotransferase [Lysobacter brunescens]|uniref:DegT/DnrJ/EryC1/StrS family aminotransferase n=1 Tax=Lysobacter brunescens TaxID=262323 RepID=A0ABW2Y9V2_9GAMM